MGVRLGVRLGSHQGNIPIFFFMRSQTTAFHHPYRPFRYQKEPYKVALDTLYPPFSYQKEGYVPEMRPFQSIISFVFMRLSWCDPKVNGSPVPASPGS